MKEIMPLQYHTPVENCTDWRKGGLNTSLHFRFTSPLSPPLQDDH